MPLSKLHRQVTRAASLANALNEDRQRRRAPRAAPAKAVPAKVIPLKHIFASVKLGDAQRPTCKTVEAADKVALAGILHDLATEWGMCEIIAVYRG